MMPRRMILTHGHIFINSSSSLIIRLREQCGFLNSADVLCVVGVRKWPLDKLYIWILFIDICG